MGLSVVLTGVSRGLGAALFSQLTGRGDRVLGIGRRFTDAQRRFADAEPQRVRLLAADLSDPGQVPDADALAGFLAPAGTAPAVLLLNAATVEPIGAVGTLAPTAVASAVNLNLLAPILLANAFVAARTGPAKVVFVSSGATRHTIAGWSVYSATKAAGEWLVEVLAAEGVDAVSVNPGVMDTSMQDTVRGADFPERGRYVGRYERGELADPADVARRILAEHL